MATRTKELLSLAPQARNFFATLIFGYVSGAPTDGLGAGEAGPGCLLVDILNKEVYKNAGTLAWPTWNSLGGVAVDEVTLAEGSILVGNSSGVGSAVVAKTSGRILVGNGTTTVLVAVSGDISLSSAGATAIVAGALAASTAGRAMMADAYFDAATVLAKFGTDSFDATALADIVGTDAFTAAIVLDTFITDAFVAATVDKAFAVGSIGEDLLTANELTGRVVANVANANVIGVQTLLHRVTIADATADTTVVLTHKERVIDFWIVKTGSAGGAGDTITLKNVATAITDALDLTLVTDKLIKRAASIDDAQHEIAAGANMVISAAKSTHVGCEAYVLTVRVA